MAKLIAVVMAILSLLSKAGPFVALVGRVVGSLWGLLVKFAVSPGGIVFLALEPSLEFIVEALTGVKGPVSSVIQFWVTKGFNLLLSGTFHVDVQGAINGLPANVMQFCRYIKLLAAMQLAMHGILNGMVVIVTYEVGLILFRIKTMLVERGLGILGMRR
jgi:hypothetical protein